MEISTAISPFVKRLPSGKGHKVPWVLTTSWENEVQSSNSHTVTAASSYLREVTLHFRLLVWRAEREAWLKVIWLWALEWSPHNYSIMTLLTIDNSMKIHRTRSKDIDMEMKRKTFLPFFYQIDLNISWWMGI